MKSKRSQEGYLMIDHRYSPGIPDELLIPIGMPAGVGRGLQEMTTITCSHCQTILIQNPLRTRERGYCPKCDHYVCDRCNAIRIQTGQCKTWRQVVEEQHEKIIKEEGLTLIRLV
jgi:hypothetical protein